MAREGPVTAGARSGSLWAITAYFNPMRYERRLSNYRVFREHLCLPLVAVELSYGPDFELEEDDADILIRLRGRDVMWQKERLLNVALAGLPDVCRKVVWMDCDVVFESDQWAEHLDGLLDRVMLVQAFSRVDHMPRNGIGADTPTAMLFTQPSFVLAIASGTPASELLANRIPSGPGSTNKGLAWAARRELLDAIGVYDACIVGGGDLALVAAVYGCFDAPMRNMNDRQCDHYLAWARRWREGVAGDTGVLDHRLRHLWHGDVSNRGYRERHAGFRPYDFDPFEDIARDDEGGWRWSTAKPEMHEYVRSYFASRHEDG